VSIDLAFIAGGSLLFADGLGVLAVVGIIVVTITTIVSATCGYRAAHPTIEAIQRLREEWKGKSRYPVAENCPSCGKTA